MIPSINIAGDADLARIGQKLVALTAYSSDELKADPELCRQIAAAATLILADIGEAYQQAA
jgi:hypothetical protein